MLLHGDSYVSSVAVAGVTYSIEQLDVTGRTLLAAGAGGEHLLVTIEDNFILVGVGSPGSSVACYNVVNGLKMKLNQP